MYNMYTVLRNMRQAFLPEAIARTWLEIIHTYLNTVCFNMPQSCHTKKVSQPNPFWFAGAWLLVDWRVYQTKWCQRPRNKCVVQT